KKTPAPKTHSPKTPSKNQTSPLRNHRLIPHTNDRKLCCRRPLPACPPAPCSMPHMHPEIRPPIRTPARLGQRGKDLAVARGRGLVDADHVAAAARAEELEPLRANGKGLPKVLAEGCGGRGGGEGGRGCGGGGGGGGGGKVVVVAAGKQKSQGRRDDV